ncbi:DUF397 domain-containing protein [Streptomyces anandii]|uniref:DUF397 domain-containing protein n=1 Tax=Streptomyces anandii TaxID=285454 RepID=UPI00378C1656
MRLREPSEPGDHPDGRHSHPTAIHIRDSKNDSKNTDGLRLVVTPTTWTAFVACAAGAWRPGGPNCHRQDGDLLP